MGFPRGRTDISITTLHSGHFSCLKTVYFSNIFSLKILPFLVSSYSLPVFSFGLRHTAIPFSTKLLRMSLVLFREIFSFNSFASLQIRLGILGLSTTLIIASLCLPLTSQLYKRKLVISLPYLVSAIKTVLIQDRYSLHGIYTERPEYDCCYSAKEKGKAKERRRVRI